jgi:hypothetical protein
MFLLPAALRAGDGLLQKYDWGLFHDVLTRRLAHQPAGFVPFDAARRERRGWCGLTPRPIVLVEDIAVLYCRLVQQTASKAVYVDADTSLREQRQLARLVEEGQYRGVPHDTVAARIRGKKVGEDPLVRAQLPLCQVVVDTAAAIAGAGGRAA